MASLSAGPDWQAGWFDWGPLESYAPPSPARLAPWLKAHVHVKGHPEWIFVKLHTHGLQSQAIFLSPALDELFEAMEETWNRPPFRLHYATAREAYNLVKAAEAGRAGNPSVFRDFEVAVPANRLIACEAPWHLLAREPNGIRLHLLDDAPARVQVRADRPQFLQGRGELHIPICDAEQRRTAGQTVPR